MTNQNLVQGTGWNPINQSYKVDNEGIKLITDYVGSYIKEELIIPKRVFIEAYNKYIKEANDVD